VSDRQATSDDNLRKSTTEIGATHDVQKIGESKVLQRINVQNTLTIDEIIGFIKENYLLRILYVYLK